MLTRCVHQKDKRQWQQAASQEIQLGYKDNIFHKSGPVLESESRELKNSPFLEIFKIWLDEAEQPDQSS